MVQENTADQTKNDLADIAEDHEGLTSREWERRYQKYGPNDIIEEKKNVVLETLLEGLKDPMLWFLLGTSGLYFLLGDMREAWILLAAIVPLLGMDSYLHRRTKASVESLKSLLQEKATVKRGAKIKTIPSREIVPGDLVFLRAGTAVPADGVVVEQEGLQLDESSLTGESLPIRKQAVENHKQVSKDPQSMDDKYGCRAGTRVLSGKGLLRIMYTGANTRYGEIARSASAFTRETTPLQQAVQKLVKKLVIVAVGFCILLAVVRYMQGFGIIDALISAVTLAVAALPEEFPLVMTFFLAIGVYRLAQRKALVRRAVVVESIGRVTTILSDKTGTLTQGRLAFHEAYPAKGFEEDDVIRRTALAAREGNRDPIDKAIFEANKKPCESTHIVKTYPFTENRKRETSIVQMDDGAIWAFSKGSPETIFAMLSANTDLEPYEKQAEDYARQGYRVIASAQKRLSEKGQHSFERDSGSEPESGYELIGLLTFVDPIREGVSEAISHCLAAGIRVIMVTGDHPATARTLAKKLGLGGENQGVVSGDEIEAMEDRKDKQERLKGVCVVARATPMQKKMVLDVLQDQGEMVAVTGDGVNDVPILKSADIGIAMGKRGVQSAREVAAIVLLDDNFATLVQAIREGKRLFQSLKKSFAYIMMFHIPLVTTAALIPLFGYPLLYLPIHIVWLELIVHPTALLAFQGKQSSLMEAGRERETQSDTAKNHRRAASFFSTNEWVVISLTGFVIALVLSAGYLVGIEKGGIELARSYAMLIFISGSVTITAFTGGVRKTMALFTIFATLVFAILVVNIPALAEVFFMQPLSPGILGLLILVGLVSGLPVLFLRIGSRTAH